VSAHRLLVVLDVDSTLTQDEGIDLLAACVSEGVAQKVARITAQAMRGELDFERALRQRVTALSGVTRQQLEAATRSVRLTEGARELVTGLRSKGHLVGAVSGGFHQMIDPLAEDLELDFHRANTLEIVDDVLTGDLVGPIIGAREKANTLLEWASTHGIDQARTVAIGDGGNDVFMLQEAGLGIAFMAKPIAKEAADIVLDTPNLAEVLDLLGFLDA
jgi:phosphoserine phosphatase